MTDPDRKVLRAGTDEGPASTQVATPWSCVKHRAAGSHGSCTQCEREKADAGKTADAWKTVSYDNHVIEYKQDGRLVTELRRHGRSAHVSPGLVFNDENYIGSYADDFHGGPEGSLSDIVRWLVGEGEEDVPESSPDLFTTDPRKCKHGNVRMFCGHCMDLTDEEAEVEARRAGQLVHDATRDIVWEREVATLRALVAEDLQADEQLNFSDNGTRLRRPAPMKVDPRMVAYLLDRLAPSAGAEVQRLLNDLRNDVVRNGVSKFSTSHLVARLAACLNAADRLADGTGADA